MKTNELSGTDLDWAVARAEEQPHRIVSGLVFIPGGDNWNPSSNWAQGGPIIERERIGIEIHPGCESWISFCRGVIFTGSTPLIAAMRCYVSSKLGDEVEIPEELLTTC